MACGTGRRADSSRDSRWETCGWLVIGSRLTPGVGEKNQQRVARLQRRGRIGDETLAVQVGHVAAAAGRPRQCTRGPAAETGEPDRPALRRAAPSASACATPARCRGMPNNSTVIVICHGPPIHEERVCTLPQALSWQAAARAPTAFPPPRCCDSAPGCRGLAGRSGPARGLRPRGRRWWSWAVRRRRGSTTPLCLTVIVAFFTFLPSSYLAAV